MISTSGSSTDALHKYRQAYQDDNVIMRSNRFQTETSRMKHASFQTIPECKLLPGTPQAIQNLRNKLINNHGILALSAVRFVFSKHKGPLISSLALRSCLTELGVMMPSTEYFQVRYKLIDVILCVMMDCIDDWIFDS